MPDDIFRWVIAGGVAIAAISMVVQAIATMVLLRSVNSMKAKVMPLADKSGPILDKVRTAVDDLAPKVKVISADAVEITKTARVQVERTGELLKDFSERARVQVARIDGAVDETVEQVQHASESVKAAVLKPVREVDGVLTGIRTAFSVYAHGRQESVDHATQDEEMFI